MKEVIFWRDDSTEVGGMYNGGYFYRAFDLVKFLDTIRETGQEPVGIRFEEGSNNIEIIVKDKS